MHNRVTAHMCERCFRPRCATISDPFSYVMLCNECEEWWAYIFGFESFQKTYEELYSEAWNELLEGM